MKTNRIPVEPLREAFLKSGITAGEVARRCGWYRKVKGKKRRPDAGKVKVLLGLRVMKSNHVRRTYERRDGTITIYDYDRVYYYHRKTVSEKDALLIVQALDLAPLDFGL